jgi:hypothetical protein
MTANTHSTGVKKAINIVETMNEKDRYKNLAREREEARLNEALALGATWREAKLSTARKLLGMHMPPEQIAEATELPLKIIENLQSENGS